jgi:hypothetical protein
VTEQKATRAEVIAALDAALAKLHAFLETPRPCDARLIGVEPALRDVRFTFYTATAFGQDRAPLERACDEIKELADAD